MPNLFFCLLLVGAPRAASLTGVVAEGDIYDGERLVGASVWIDGVGSTSTNSSGTYLIEGLAAGSYTVHAAAEGYLEGTCSRSVESSGEFWCSIALQVDPGGEDTGDSGEDTGDSGEDTGDSGEDTEAPHDDTAVDDTSPPGVFPPGSWVPLYGCQAAAGAPAAILGLLGLLGLCRRR